MCDFHLPVPLRSSPYSSLARPIRMENHLVLISASLTPFPVTSEEKEGNCDFIWLRSSRRSSHYSSLARPIRKENDRDRISASLTLSRRLPR